MPTPRQATGQVHAHRAQANSLKNVARLDTPHKIKKAKPPVAKKVSNKPQAKKAATQTKLNIELPTKEKSKKAPQKTPKPEKKVATAENKQEAKKQKSLKQEIEGLNAKFRSARSD